MDKAMHSEVIPFISTGQLHDSTDFWLKVAPVNELRELHMKAGGDGFSGFYKALKRLSPELNSAAVALSLPDAQPLHVLRRALFFIFYLINAIEVSSAGVEYSPRLLIE